ncbi:winged helix-turn-helix transcriptional regulator, partial [Pseudomonas fluorescens]
MLAKAECHSTCVSTDQSPSRSVTELADRVGLSLSPCHRRVRALEESGVL